MSEGDQSPPSGPGANFLGTWILDKNDNFDAFLAANGANWLIRKMAGASTPTLDVTRDGDKFTFKLHSMVMTKECSYTPGETVEEKQHSGDVMVCTPSWDGEKLVVEMKPKEESSDIKPQKHTRHVEGDQFILTLEVGDVAAKRIFKKQN